MEGARPDIRAVFLKRQRLLIAGPDLGLLLPRIRSVSSEIPCGGRAATQMPEVSRLALSIAFLLFTRRRN